MGLHKDILYIFASVFSWFHSCIIAPLVRWWEDSVLGTWEHLVVSVVRELGLEWTRMANGLSAWFISLFKHGYRDDLRRAWKQNQPRSHEAQSRPSTLNAIIEALHRTDSRSTPDTSGATDMAESAVTFLDISTVRQGMCQFALSFNASAALGNGIAANGMLHELRQPSPCQAPCNSLPVPVLMAQTDT
jgi:hypothetical protein